MALFNLNIADWDLARTIGAARGLSTVVGVPCPFALTFAGLSMHTSGDNLVLDAPNNNGVIALPGAHAPLHASDFLIL